MDLSQYLAVRRSAGVFDRSSRGKIAVAGSDRRSYLHAMLTNDIQALQPGSGCYAAYLTPQGRMVADMTVLELGDMVLLDLPPVPAADVLQRLDQYVFSEDVRLGNLTDAFAKLSIVGPRAAAVLSAALSVGGLPQEGADLGDWPEFRNARTTFRGEMVLVAASRELGTRGYDLYIERPHVEALGAALAAAGTVAAGDEVFETLRVEAGRPAFGVDMDADTIPLEAGIEGRAISFTKGCYPGQEVVIRILHRGHGRVARRLVGLVMEGDVVPAAGDLLRDGDRDAGRVTSAVMSPAAGRPIALAMVHRDFTAPDTRLSVLHGSDLLPARVSALPFTLPA